MTSKDSRCFYYGACGNELEGGEQLMCGSCLGKARHRDKLGAHREEDLLAFTERLYEVYESPEEIMSEMYERGVKEVVRNVTE